MITDELKKITGFTDEKPVLTCEDCGHKFEPVGWSKTLHWPTFQSPLCPDCYEVHRKIYSKNEIQEIMSERSDKINSLMMDCGAPPDKVLKVLETDFDTFDVQDKPVEVNRIVKALKTGHQFFISGKTDSGKTHLSTYLFKQLLLELYQIPVENFYYAYDYKIYNRIIKDPLNKAAIIEDLMRTKVLFLTFGEFRGAGGFNGNAKEIYKEMLFNILDHRLEYDLKNVTHYFITCYISTYDGEDIENFYGLEFKNRLYEKSYLIEMKQENRRINEFNERNEL